MHDKKATVAPSESMQQKRSVCSKAENSTIQKQSAINSGKNSSTKAQKPYRKVLSARSLWSYRVLVSAVQSQTAIQYHLFLVGIVGINTEEAGSSVITDDAEVHHIEWALQKKKSRSVISLPLFMVAYLNICQKKCANSGMKRASTHAHAHTHALMHLSLIHISEPTRRA